MKLIKLYKYMDNDNVLWVANMDAGSKPIRIAELKEAYLQNSEGKGKREK